MQKARTETGDPPPGQAGDPGANGKEDNGRLRGTGGDFDSSRNYTTGANTDHGSQGKSKPNPFPAEPYRDFYRDSDKQWQSKGCMRRTSSVATTANRVPGNRCWSATC